MKELVVLSGKGGTGKTSVVGALAVLAESKVLADGDVDAANLHLLLNPVPRTSQLFQGLPKAKINRNDCLKCDFCAHLCRFGAIKGFQVDPLACEGCGVCYHACPCEAITMVKHVAGELYLSDTGYGPLVHARLGIAEENSGKLVAAVRTEARRVAAEEGKGLVITDGPPGIGCPVIACLAGVDLVLVVTEPSQAGKHDLIRLLDLVAQFQEQVVVCPVFIS